MGSARRIEAASHSCQFRAARERLLDMSQRRQVPASNPRTFRATTSLSLPGDAAISRHRRPSARSCSRQVRWSYRQRSASSDRNCADRSGQSGRLRDQSSDERMSNSQSQGHHEDRAPADHPDCLKPPNRPAACRPHREGRARRALFQDTDSSYANLPAASCIMFVTYG